MIKIPPDVYLGFTALAEEKIPLIDKVRCEAALQRLGFQDTLKWMREHRTLFDRGVLEGFDGEPDEEGYLRG